MLHVTNGDCTVEIMRRAHLVGDIVASGERVVLWFEHDLYDQLQLLQILAGLPDRPVGVELICVGSFPGRPDFAGLGELDPDELASLWPVRTPVVNEHVRAARAAWDAFRAPDPSGLGRAATSSDALNGFDRWLGGMHLRAGDGLWRWDVERAALVEP